VKWLDRKGQCVGPALRVVTEIAEQRSSIVLSLGRRIRLVRRREGLVAPEPTFGRSRDGSVSTSYQSRRGKDHCGIASWRFAKRER